jgi:hypothetical protein
MGSANFVGATLSWDRQSPTTNRFSYISWGC